MPGSLIHSYDRWSLALEQAHVMASAAEDERLHRPHEGEPAALLPVEIKDHPSDFNKHSAHSVLHLLDRQTR